MTSGHSIWGERRREYTTGWAATLRGSASRTSSMVVGMGVVSRVSGAGCTCLCEGGRAGGQMPTGLYGWGGLYGGCHGVFGFWFAGRPELRCCVLLLTVMLLCLTSVWDEENIFLVGFIPPDIHDGLLWLSVHHGGMGVIKTVWSPPELERYTFTRGRKYHAIVSVWKLSPTMALCLLRRRTPLVGVPVSSPLIQRTRPPPSTKLPS